MVFPEKQSQPAGCRFSALPREQKLRFQQRNSRFPVTEFTIQRHLHKCTQWVALQIQELSGIEMRRAVVQIARKVNVQHLLRVAGRGEVRAQILQPSRAESRLLRELARRRPLRCFPRVRACRPAARAACAKTDSGTAARTRPCRRPRAAAPSRRPDAPRPRAWPCCRRGGAPRRAGR